MNRLTRQEQLVLAVLLFLLATGWVVRTWKTAHRPQVITDSTNSSAVRLN